MRASIIFSSYLIIHIFLNVLKLPLDCDFSLTICNVQESTSGEFYSGDETNYKDETCARETAIQLNRDGYSDHSSLQCHNVGNNLSNIANNPMEEEYHKVKVQNAAFSKRLGGLTGDGPHHQ